MSTTFLRMKNILNSKYIYIILNLVCILGKINSVTILSKFEKISNLIPSQNVSFIFSHSLDKTKCLAKCNSIPKCKVAVTNESPASCLLYGKVSSNDMVNSTDGTMYVKKGEFNSELVSYWPIFNNDLTDYVGQSDMFDCANQLFVEDRFGNANSAVFFNDGYCKVPPGVYFSGDFTITAWVKVIQYRKWSRLLDFGNGGADYEIIFSICNDGNSKPKLCIYSLGASILGLESLRELNLSEWTHLTGVNRKSNVSIYLNGQFSSFKLLDSNAAKITRTKNFIGRSLWYPNDQDANAYFDDIKIFNRALTDEEILFDMNNF